MATDNPIATAVQTALAEEPKRRSGPHAPLPTGIPVATDTQPDVPKASPGVYAEEDPRIRAARRAAELREKLGDNLGDDQDPFYIDPKIIPPGWSYEYKRHTLLGAKDPSYEVSIAQTGWDPVPLSRHRFMMPDNWQGNTIEKKGMILMERPAEITAQVLARELSKARGQVGDKEAQLYGAPAGTAPRDNKGTPLVKVGRSYEPMPIPKE